MRFVTHFSITNLFPTVEFRLFNDINVITSAWEKEYKYNGKLVFAQ